jgi:anti-sigma B factor antagonist
MANRVVGLTLKQFPDTFNVTQGRTFLRDLQSNTNGDRPYIVLDLSKVRRMDRSAINLLLGCLEEALKQNGDVKLAAIPLEVRAVLKLTGVDGLFEIYDTNAEAMNSFRRLPATEASRANLPISSYRASVDAA